MRANDLTDGEREFEDERQRLYRESVTVEIEEIDGCKIYVAREIGSGEYECDSEAYRVIAEYEAVRERQRSAEHACAEAREFDWPEPEIAEADEPAPETVPPAGRLTARQLRFCEHYATQPVATRAAALAGYAEDSAYNQGHRLLKNPLVLARVAELRAERRLRYVVQADTLHDKLEAVLFDALSGGKHSAAVAALRLQAGLAGLAARPTGAAEPKARPARARKAKRRGRRRKDEKRRGRGRKNDEKR